MGLFFCDYCGNEFQYKQLSKRFLRLTKDDEHKGIKVFLDDYDLAEYDFCQSCTMNFILYFIEHYNCKFQKNKEEKQNEKAIL